jgi:type I restriction enzyme S subunit
VKEWLPQHWAQATLAEVCKRIVDGSHNPPPGQPSGIPMLSARNVENGKIVFDDFRYISKEAFKLEHTRTQIAPGDVLLTIVGSIGRSATVEDGTQQFALQRSVAVLKPIILNRRFCMYQLQSDWVQKQLTEHSRGTAQKGVYLKLLGQVKLKIAPLSEQGRIVAEIEKQFTRLDAAVATLKRLQANLRRYRAAILKAACEGRLVPTEAELTRREGRSTPRLQTTPSQAEPVPEGWCWTDLSALVVPLREGVKTGPFGSLLKKAEHRREGIPVLGIENIERMRFLPRSKIHISPEKALELGPYDARPGDILISRSGTVGEVCVVPHGIGEVRISTNLMRLRLVQERVQPQFFTLLFNGSPHVLAQISALCSGSTRDFLNNRILRSLRFPLPPRAEQARIVAEVDKHLSVLEETESQLSIGSKRSEKLRHAILKRAFEGKLVAQDPNDESANLLLERILGTTIPCCAPTPAKGNLSSRRARAPKETVHA